VGGVEAAHAARLKVGDVMTRQRDLYDWTGPRRDVTVGDASFALPLVYHANDVFMSLHAADPDAVAAALPSGLVRPVRWVDGRALIAVTAFRYSAVTWKRRDGTTGSLVPYGEIAVTAVVTRGPARRALPLLRRRLSGYVLHLPVTTKQARDGGTALWGFPKFLADMDFAEAPGQRQVRLAEGGVDILTLSVWPARGPALPERRPLVTYSVVDGHLVETTIPVRGNVTTRLGARAGELLLGDHEVATGLRRMEMDRTSVLAFSWLDHRSLLPDGQVLGPAPAPARFVGADRDLGRFTVRYPGTPALDQYAAVTTTA